MYFGSRLAPGCSDGDHDQELFCTFGDGEPIAPTPGEDNLIQPCHQRNVH